MNGLGVELRRHRTGREAFCRICGGLSQQERFAAVLVRNGVPLGELCPRCLGIKPRLAARRLRKRAGRIGERAHSLCQRGGYPELAEILLGNARVLDALAEQLPEAWGVTPEDLRRAEEAALQELFPRVPGDVLSRLVDGRHVPAC
jgi:hypothetical protein